MATKNQILNNIREYSASEIADAIRGGELSLYELSKSGNLSPLLRKRIEEHLNDNLRISSSEQERDVNSLSEELDSVIDNNVESTIVDKSIIEDLPVVTSSNITSSEANLSSNDGNRSWLKDLFSFKGRMRRLHYGLSIIAFYVVIILIFVIGDVVEHSTRSSSIFIIPGLILGFFALWFVLAARIKRCHDRGNSGWWLLYTCIPYVGAIFNLILLFGSGDEDENEYGPNPKN